MEKDNQKKTRLIPEWIVAIIIAAVMLLTFAYVDLQSLTVWSTNLWDVIAQGDITQYFAYTGKNIYEAPHQYVTGTLYSLIPWAIWNLPIWIVQYYFHIPILESPTLMLWSSMFLVVCLIGVIWLVRKITYEITKDEKSSNLAVFLTFSSVWTYIGVFYAGQNDIMICLLGLMAVYALIKKKTKLFLLAASFAISIKYFFFFPFVALVLLTEKNIYKIIGKIGIGLVPTLLYQIICSSLPMFNPPTSSNLMASMLTQMTWFGVPGLGGVTISLFILALVFVYIISYVTIPKEKEYSKLVIYTTVIAIAPLILFTKIQFYRTILIVPFLIILLVQNKRMLKLNLILEIAAEIGIFLTMIFTVKFIFAPRCSAFGTIPSILNLDVTALSLGENILKSFPDIRAILPLFSTVAVASISALLIINHPRFKGKYIELKEEKFERWLLWIRPLTVAVCTAAMYITMC